MPKAGIPGQSVPIFSVLEEFVLSGKPKDWETQLREISPPDFTARLHHPISPPNHNASGVTQLIEWVNFDGISHNLCHGTGLQSQIP